MQQWQETAKQRQEPLLSPWHAPLTLQVRCMSSEMPHKFLTALQLLCA